MLFSLAMWVSVGLNKGCYIVHLYENYFQIDASVGQVISSLLLDFNGVKLNDCCSIRIQS